MSDIEEKLAQRPSPYAVKGLYLYHADIVVTARQVKPSLRGELEITSINSAYLALGNLLIEKLGRSLAWLDTGTPESLTEASLYLQSIEYCQEPMIAYLEEIV